MKSVPIYDFWFFGTCVRFIQDLRPGVEIHSKGMVVKTLEVLFTKIDDLQLTVTNHTQAARDLDDMLRELRSTPPDARLTPEHCVRLNTAMDNLRLTMEGELLSMKAFMPAPKRLELPKLLGDTASLFAPKVFDSLSDIAKSDMIEAARCIAYERPTAAAFHMMRGTEETLRRYYCHFVKKNRCNPLLWYPMVQGLHKHRATKSHAVLLRNLDNIRLSFRNPTQHPDKTYDIQEAQDLWGLCVDVITRMQKATGVVH